MATGSPAARLPDGRRVLAQRGRGWRSRRSGSGRCESRVDRAASGTRECHTELTVPASALVRPRTQHVSKRRSSSRWCHHADGVDEMAEQFTEDGMWYADRGVGDPLVLLHPGGAGVDSRALGPQVAAFADRFHVYTPEQRGHGRTADVSGPLSYEQMAADTIRFVEDVVGTPVLLFGVSDGAVVALTVALRRPDLVRRLVLAAGIFHRD